MKLVLRNEPLQRPGRSIRDNIIDLAYCALAIHHIQATTAQKMRVQQRGHVQAIRIRDASDRGMMGLKDSDDSAAAGRD